MANLDPVIIKRRRIGALVVLAVLITLIWGIPQLFSGPGQNAAEPEPTATEEAISAEITDCAPGVVKVEAMIGKFDPETKVAETLNSFAGNSEPYIWYEVTNTGLVDCRFNVGSRVTFFTITSGEQTYYSSRDCDRSTDKDLTVLLQANVPLKAEPSIWERVYSSPEGCSVADGMQQVPTGGATYKIKAEVNGVISDEVRFILN